MFTVLLRCLLGVSLVASVCTDAATAGDGPIPPCAETTVPTYPILGEPAAVRTWSFAGLSSGWTPPDCLEWGNRNFAVLVTVAGRFGPAASSKTLLQRLANVSRLKTIRYWSYSRKEWRHLLDEAMALKGSDPNQIRADFDPTEFEPNRDFFMWQKENSLASGVVLATRFRDISKRRLIFDQINITASTILTMTILEPRAFQTTYFLERESDDVWRYFSLTRFGATGETLSKGEIASIINRSVALFRYLGALPMTREPAAAP